MASEMGSRIDRNTTDAPTGDPGGPPRADAEDPPITGPAFPSHELATYHGLLDARTGLPGWVLLLDRTTMALARARRTHRAAAVLVVDRPRNATGGASVPVETVVELLRERIRPDDTLAQLDPDRYAILCPDLRAPADADRIAERLVRHGSDLIFGIGIAVGGAGDDAVQLISWASQHAHVRDD